MSESITAGYHRVTPAPEVMLALGRFAGAVAHDFNNLLTAIGSYAELLSLEVPADTPVAEDVALLRAAAARAAELTRTLQRLAHPPQPAAIRVGLRRHVESAAVRHAERFADGRLSIELPASDPLAMVEPGELTGALDALLANARSASPAGARVRIVLDEIDVAAGAAAALEPGRYARISVEDEGRGMDDATLRRAFEPLFGTEPGVARGLGLCWVERFARAAGGMVELASAPGRGSVVSIFLPVAMPAIRPQDAEAA